MPEKINSDLYRKVKKEEEKEEDKPENELRVSARDDAVSFIKTGIKLLKEDNHKTIYVKGLGGVVAKTILVAEMIKRRVKGLHQITKFDPTTLVDTYEPKVAEKNGEKLETKTIERTVHLLTIELSTEELDTKNMGYQAPLPESEVEEGAEIDLPHEVNVGKKAGARNAKGQASRGRGSGVVARGGRGGGGGTGGRGGVVTGRGVGQVGRGASAAAGRKGGRGTTTRPQQGGSSSYNNRAGGKGGRQEGYQSYNTGGYNSYNNRGPKGYDTSAGGYGSYPSYNNRRGYDQGYDNYYGQNQRNTRYTGGYDDRSGYGAPQRRNDYYSAGNYGANSRYNEYPRPNQPRY